MSFPRILSNKYGKQLLHTTTKKRLGSQKTALKKVVHKDAEATSEFRGNKIGDKIVKLKPVPDNNLIDVEEMFILPEKRDEILNEFRQVL